MQSGLMQLNLFGTGSFTYSIGNISSTNCSFGKNSLTNMTQCKLAKNKYSIQHAVFLDFICILHVESLNQINQNKPHLTEQSDTLKRISQSA